MPRNPTPSHSHYQPSSFDLSETPQTDRPNNDTTAQVGEEKTNYLF